MSRSYIFSLKITYNYYTFEHADIVDTEILGEVEDWVKDYG